MTDDLDSGTLATMRQELKELRDRNAFLERAHGVAIAPPIVRPQNLVWVDIETTGLDPRCDYLLEIALVLTDPNLNVLDRTTSCVIGSVTQKAVERMMDDYVKDVHTKSGLLEALGRGDGMDLYDAHDVLLDETTEWFDPENPSPMCGSSIHFDREFLRVDMPRLEARFHYRNFDISSLKIAVQSWDPYGATLRPTPAALHRAMPDIEDTLAEARYYKALLFDSRKP